MMFIENRETRWFPAHALLVAERVALCLLGLAHLALHVLELLLVRERAVAVNRLGHLNCG